MYYPKLKRYQMDAFIHLIECILKSEDKSEDKLSKIKYWFDLIYEL